MEDVEDTVEVVPMECSMVDAEDTVKAVAINCSTADEERNKSGAKKTYPKKSATPKSKKPGNSKVDHGTLEEALSNKETPKKDASIGKGTPVRGSGRKRNQGTPPQIQTRRRKSGA